MTNINPYSILCIVVFAIILCAYQEFTIMGKVIKDISNSSKETAETPNGENATSSTIQKKNILAGEATTANHEVIKERFNLTSVAWSIGFGNQLFLFAALVGVAARNNMNVILPERVEALEFNLPHLKQWPHQSSHSGVPYSRFNKSELRMYDNRTEHFSERKENIGMLGWFHSWRYFGGYEHLVRKEIQFKPSVNKAVEEFLLNHTYANWTECHYVRVGIHIRRGDYLSKHQQDRGFVVATPEYIAHAMIYYIEKYINVQFIVASNGIDWAQKYVKAQHVVFSTNFPPAEDMHLIGSCEHVIFTTGSYGWWSAWLSNGTAIYYDHAHKPNKKSGMWVDFNRDDAYPPGWMPMS